MMPTLRRTGLIAALALILASTFLVTSSACVPSAQTFATSDGGQAWTAEG